MLITRFGLANPLLLQFYCCGCRETKSNRTQTLFVGFHRFTMMQKPTNLTFHYTLFSFWFWSRGSWRHVEGANWKWQPAAWGIGRAGQELRTWEGCVSFNWRSVYSGLFIFFNVENNVLKIFNKKFLINLTSYLSSLLSLSHLFLMFIDLIHQHSWQDSINLLCSDYLLITCIYHLYLLLSSRVLLYYL